jgi:hypothetical protein
MRNRPERQKHCSEFSQQLVHLVCDKRVTLGAPMARKKEPPTNLTIEQCFELAAAMFEDAAALPPGPKKDEILKLAQGYRNLAEMKEWLSGKLN